MRISKIVLATTMLAACNQPDNAVLAEQEKAAADAAVADGKIECALDGEEVFQSICTSESLSDASGSKLIVRRPDGGFRRFDVLPPEDGRGLAASDGAELAKITIVEENKIMVTLGADRYILPAKMKAPMAADPAAEVSADMPAK